MITVEIVQKNSSLSVIQVIGVGAGKLMGVPGISARISPTCPKSVCATFSYKFSLTKITKTYLCRSHKKFVVGCDLQKKVFMCYFDLGEKESNVGRQFCPDFRGFSTNQNFWGCACTSCTTDSSQKFIWEV